MEGYGFSTWIVPDTWNSIKSKYKMKHIPHITVRTNLEKPCAKGVGEKVRIKFISGCFIFPKQYKVDPLDAYGFYCLVKNVDFEHIPHMSLFYNEPFAVYDPPSEELEGTIYMSDTRSMDPSKWTLIDHPSTDPLDSLLS